METINKNGKWRKRRTERLTSQPASPGWHIRTDMRQLFWKTCKIGDGMERPGKGRSDNLFKARQLADLGGRSDGARLRTGESVSATMGGDR